ncbi:hypothetical protein COL922a_014965, partial [Colletotrichum nupharicola]
MDWLIRPGQGTRITRLWASRCRPSTVWAVVSLTTVTPLVGNIREPHGQQLLSRA